MDWRAIHSDQNQRMTLKMLEMQGEINRLKAELITTRAERDLAYRRGRREAAEAIRKAGVDGFNDTVWLHPDEAANIAEKEA